MTVLLEVATTVYFNCLGWMVAANLPPGSIESQDQASLKQSNVFFPMKPPLSPPTSNSAPSLPAHAGPAARALPQAQVRARRLRGGVPQAELLRRRRDRQGINRIVGRVFLLLGGLQI